MKKFYVRILLILFLVLSLFYGQITSAQSTSISIDSNFDSGNLLSVTQIAPGEYNFELNPYNFWGIWFHFRVVNAKDSTVTFHLTNVEHDWLTWDVFSPFVSPDWENWDEISNHSFDDPIYSFTYTFQTDTAYVCTHPAFTTTMMTEYLDEIESHPYVVDRQVITNSVQGRPIEKIVLTDPSYPNDEKLGVWMISRQHASELPGWYVMQGLINWLLSDDPEAMAVMQHMIFNVIPMMNPDGVYAGKYRTNSLDIDLNRQWDNADPDTEPSVYAVVDLVEQWVNEGKDFSLFLDFHSTRSGRTCFNYRYAYSTVPDIISQTYYDNQEAFLNLLNEYCPLFSTNTDRGIIDGDWGTVSSITYITSNYQYQNPKFVCITYEGINVPVDHGIYAGQPMTIELEHLNGKGFGKAIYHNYIESKWQSLGSETNNNLIGVDAISEQAAWIGGFNGTVLRTDDSGNTWNDVWTLPDTLNVYNIEGLDANNALVSAWSEEFSTTFIFKTNNGGLSWQKTYEQTNGFIDDITMFTPTEGMAIGDPVDGIWTIIETHDGGNTWTPIPNAPGANENEFGYRNGVIWISESTGWIGTNGSRAYCIQDGGMVWTEVQIPSLSDVRTLAFNKTGIGMAVSWSGELARTNDAGESWEEIASPFNGNTSYIVSQADVFWLMIDNLIFISTDNGLNWELETSTNTSLNHLDLITNEYGTYGLAVGENGHILKYVNDRIVTKVNESIVIPEEYILNQNYPNPFNPNTIITYSIMAQSHVVIKVFDIVGRDITTLVNKEQTAGKYRIEFSGKELSSGIYFYQIQTKDFVQTNKMMLLK